MRQSLRILFQIDHQVSRPHRVFCLDLLQEHVDDLAQRRAFRVPLEGIRDREHRLDDWSERLRRAQKQQLQRVGQRLEAQAARLESLSPLNVLARGYSLSRRETDQVVVRSAEQVQPGDRLVTHVQHGRIISRVEQTHRTTDPVAS